MHFCPPRLFDLTNPVIEFDSEAESYPCAVKLGVLSWHSSFINTYIAKVFIEEFLGYPVEIEFDYEDYLADDKRASPIGMANTFSFLLDVTMCSRSLIHLLLVLLFIGTNGLLKMQMMARAQPKLGHMVRTVLLSHLKCGKPLRAVKWMRCWKLGIPVVLMSKQS